MNRLNKIILEKMGDVPPVSNLNNFTRDQKSARRILRFIENNRNYYWTATYFHENDDGPTQINLRSRAPDQNSDKLLASVRASTFAPAVSLAFLAVEFEQEIE